MKEVTVDDKRAAALAALVESKPPIIVVCVSDLHGLYEEQPCPVEIPAGDLLLFAGDVELRTNQDVDRFGRWLARLPHRSKVMTYGNMDRAPEKGPIEFSEKANVQIASDSVVEVAGYRVFGSPWTPKFYGAFQLEDEAQAEQHWAKHLPPNTDVDIILTHGPPYGYGDLARGKRVGDKALLKAVQALERPPLLWVCGHIHESYGEYRVPHPRAPDGILLINAASYYVTKEEHKISAQPRAVSMPEVTVVGQGAAAGVV